MIRGCCIPLFDQQCLIHRGYLLRDNDALLINNVDMNVEPLDGSNMVHLDPLTDNNFTKTSFPLSTVRISCCI